MTTFLDEIKTKINKEFSPDQLSVIDNSHLHRKHKSFDVNKYHLKIIIKSNKFQNMKKIEAHKAIFSILAALCQSIGLIMMKPVLDLGADPIASAAIRTSISFILISFLMIIKLIPF